MSWVKLDDRLPDHPKVAPLSDAAFRAMIRGLCYANAYVTDGVLPPVFLERIPKKLRNELIASGLWDQDGTTIRIHDYHDYQEDAELVTKRRRDARERMKKLRAAREAKRSQDVRANEVPGSPIVRANKAPGSREQGVITSDPVRNAVPVPSRPVPSSTSTAAPDQGGVPRDRRGPVPVERARLIESPLAWDRKHGGHLPGFCDWVCFPVDLAEQFANRAGWDVAAVEQWARGVRQAWEAQRRVPADRMYDFWNFRWVEHHGSSTPVADGAGGRARRTSAALDRFVAGGE